MSELEQTVEAIRQKYHLPALAVCVSQRGVVTHAACGVRKLGDATKVTTDDQFHYGSCGKIVTALVIQKLADEGKLSLDDTLAHLFPTLEMDPAFQQVTIAQLLTHSSGLGKDGGTLNAPPEHPVGQFSYSNLGYILLGQIASQVTGKEFETLAKDYVFDPLEMKSAGFGPAASGTIPPDQPWGHSPDGEGKPVPNRDDNPDAYAAAGRIHASMDDWMKLLQFEMEQRRLVMPKYTSDFAPGQYYTDMAFIQAGKSFQHDGSNGANYTRQILLPEQRSALLLTCNDGSPNAQRAMDELSQVLQAQVAQAQPKHYRPPKLHRFEHAPQAGWSM